ncbi:MAG: hypothetical protein MJE77_44120 [Proteobacteria bacterium]|nr:hypothetical protein [Pseudomonadota bacterium]
MTIRRKSREGDEELVVDETADPVARCSAMGRLLADRRFEFRRLARNWLDHPDPLLRDEAPAKLLIYFRDHPGVEADVARVKTLARTDPEPLVRGAAVRALSSYLKLAKRDRSDILRTLVHVLETDDEWSTQLTCYEELIERIAPHRRNEVPSGKSGFDRSRQVDWDLLAEWREQNR